MMKRHIALCCSIAFFACLLISCTVIDGESGDVESGSVLKSQSVTNSPEKRTIPTTEPSEKVDPVVFDIDTPRRTPIQTTNSNPISNPKLTTRPEKKQVPPEIKLDPQEEEEAAEKLAELAVDQVRNNRIGEARKLMEEIIKRYPNTDTAEEIRKILKSIR